jgi:hypothetical protein
MNDAVIGTSVIVSGPGTQFEWLWYLYVGRNVTGVSWDELPVLRESAPMPIGEKLPSHFKDQRPWRYRIEAQRQSDCDIVVSPSINKSNGWWHNEGIWRVRAVHLGGIAHTFSGRQRQIINALIELNLPEHTASLIDFREKIYGTAPLST